VGLLTALDIPKVRFLEPERNLPGRRPHVITTETRFTLLFARAYLEQHRTIHYGTTKNETVCARQVAINGFGIADLVSISWASVGRDKTSFSVDDFLKVTKPTVRAFEIKLNNWRKGMTQAHRYRYFANVAILVLPKERCEIARAYLSTFQKIHVGLWAFDTASCHIVPYYTPHPASAIETKYRKRVLQIIAGTSRALPVLRKP
jgi:hypothetical protein